MQSNIKVDSVVNKGSTFSFPLYLPYSHEQLVDHIDFKEAG